MIVVTTVTKYTHYTNCCAFCLSVCNVKISPQNGIITVTRSAYTFCVNPQQSFNLVFHLPMPHRHHNHSIGIGCDTVQSASAPHASEPDDQTISECLDGMLHADSDDQSHVSVQPWVAGKLFLTD